MRHWRRRYPAMRKEPRDWAVPGLVLLAAGLFYALVRSLP